MFTNFMFLSESKYGQEDNRLIMERKPSYILQARNPNMIAYIIFFLKYTGELRIFALRGKELQFEQAHYVQLLIWITHKQRQSSLRAPAAVQRSTSSLMRPYIFFQICRRALRSFQILPTGHVWFILGILNTFFEKKISHAWSTK